MYPSRSYVLYKQQTLVYSPSEIFVLIVYFWYVDKGYPCKLPLAQLASPPPIHSGLILNDKSTDSRLNNAAAIRVNVP